MKIEPKIVLEIKDNPLGLIALGIICLAIGLGGTQVELFISTSLANIGLTSNPEDLIIFAPILGAITFIGLIMIIIGIVLIIQKNQ